LRTVTETGNTGTLNREREKAFVLSQSREELEIVTGREGTMQLDVGRGGTEGQDKIPPL
jgi:hypothetical protein